MASYSGMSAEDIKMREDYKKQQAAAITASRDYKKNNYLSAMEQQTATQPSVTTTPKTNTNTQTLGGTSSTGGSSSSGGYTGGGYVAGSGTTTRNARRNAHAADIRSGYKLRNEAEDETQSLSYYDKLSDYDRDVRTQYFYDKKAQENAQSQTAPREPNIVWDDIKEEGQRRNSLSEFQIEQRDGYTDMLRKADEAGYAPSSHHLMDIRRQLDDTQAWIDISTKRSEELKEEFERANQRFPNGAWQQGTTPQTIPSTKEEIDLRLGVIALEIAEKKKQLDLNITYEDIMDLNSETYIANSQYNLEERHRIEEEILKLTLERKNLLNYKHLQGLTFPDNILGQPAAFLMEGVFDEDLNSDYSIYKKDPTEERKRYILANEALMDQFQENNKQTLDDNSLYPEFLRELVHDIPREEKNWAATEAGKKTGFLVSGGNPIGKALGGAVANGTDTYNAAFGQAFRGFLQSGVDEETAKKAAHDEAIIVACLNAAGGIAEDKVSDLLTAPISNPFAKKIVGEGIEFIANLPISAAEELLSEENKIRIWLGETNGGAADLLERAVIRCLFLKGFDEG